MKLPSWPNPNYFHHINLGLDRVLELLKRLDNPHLKMPPTIHIAGTNGKGSILAFLKNIYEEAGYKVHRYTSPHLVEFNERIEILGQKISDDFLQQNLDECQQACELEPKIDITFFEATTACAFLAFSKVKADILLLETGMGGEFDATNVLPQVFQSIISPIDLDHQEYLGGDIQKIALAKVGIIKKNSVVISSKQSAEVSDIIDERVKKLNAKNIKTLDFCNELNFDFSELEIPLKGNHQFANCQTAITAIKCQNVFKISDANILQGIKNTRWPARLEKINYGKFYKNLPSNFELYLDGSHNIQGATTIKEFLNEARFNQGFGDENFDKKIIIFQMLRDKNCEEFVKIINPNFNSKENIKINKLYSFNIEENPNFRKAEEIINICKFQKIETEIALGFDDIFNKIKSEFSNQKTLILICGSLYFAGKFLEENQT